MADRSALAAVMEDDPSEADEYLDVPAPLGYTTADAPDGGLVITLNAEGPDTERRGGVGEFFDNLAEEILPESVLQTIASDLLLKIEEDKEAFADRDKQQAEDGLRRTGMGKDAPGGAPFEGASKAVHPMVTEACIDFQSRVMKELWRPSGPCRPNLTGEVTKDKVDRAKRKSDFMNLQLTKKIKEARSVVEKLLSQLPLGGSQFIRLWWDHRLKRPRMKMVTIDRVYLPDSAENYVSADRRTFSDTISATELKRRMASGMYRQIDIGPAPQRPDQTRSEEANRKISGSRESGLNIDGDREIYETMAVLEVTSAMADDLDHEEEGSLCPYLITIDVTSRKILSMYRDWEEDDEAREPIEHLFEFGFLPWRGPYDIGLPQAMAGLPGAATGSLRALLDSALVANTQGGLILKGSGTSGQAKRANPNEFIEIESGMEADDIRKKVMQFNTKEPSSVLFQLLGFLVEAGKSVVRTSMDDKTLDSNTTVPVGTQLSRVEEGLVIFNAIHGRVYTAFNRLLEGLHRLNRLYLPKVVREDNDGKQIIVRRRDFEGNSDVIPVAEPTICSDQVRMGQVTAMQQRSAMAPGLYNVRELEAWFLDLMKVPDKDRFLADEPKPTEMNAVNENVAMALGRPVVAFPDQDHLAHLQVLFDFMNSPVFGSNPLIAPKFLPAAIQHAVEHIVYYYVQKTTQTVEHYAGVEVTELFSKDNDVRTELDRLLAKVSSTLMPGIQQDFSQALPVLQKAQALLQKLAPPPPMDPAVAGLQAAQAETQRKGAADQATAQDNQAKLQVQQQANAQKAQNDQVRNAVDMQRVNALLDNAQTAANARLTETEMDNDSAQQIAAMRVETGQAPRFSTGSSMGGV
jgi:hypothetical protein